MLPFWLSECAVEAWYEGYHYGKIEVDRAKQVEIRLVKIGESNSQQVKPNVDINS